MKYLLRFNETLKSDNIDIVVKKISKFFEERGFKERNNPNVRSPFYKIYSDRDAIRSSIKEYENPTQSTIDHFKTSSHSIDNMLDFHKKSLEYHTKGDIYIYTSSTKKITPKLVKDFLHLIESVGYFLASSGSFENELKDKSKIEEYIY